mmetsp:Transcript_15604/g.42574  ORF Transcript_15604/g.42574 Transcript_15604/m.42574 type:complete len:112 (-) Transcript_15604:396-731(-)
MAVFIFLVVMREHGGSVDDCSLTSDDLKQRTVAHQLDIGDYEGAKEAETKVRAIDRLLKRNTLNGPRPPEMAIKLLCHQNFSRKQTFLGQSSSQDLELLPLDVKRTVVART